MGDHPLDHIADGKESGIGIIGVSLLLATAEWACVLQGMWSIWVFGFMGVRVILAILFFCMDVVSVGSY